MSDSSDDWDPFLRKGQEWRQKTPIEGWSYRIKRELMTICKDPPYGLFIVPDETDIGIVHALITGPSDTPYDGGFFYFILRYPPNYPSYPPKVKLMTTGGGQVRFNPNLYQSGKVCLSILGTWPGPSWNPALNLSALLVSIQSILNEKPYHNEPGFEVEKLPGDAARYNDIIQHETLRVAVCGMVENDSGLTIPKSLTKIIQNTFLGYYEFYEGIAKKKLHLTGQLMQDPFFHKRGNFQYDNILSRLQSLRKKLLAEARTNVIAKNLPSETLTPSDTDCDEDSSLSFTNALKASLKLVKTDDKNSIENGKSSIDQVPEKSCS